jgi:hypothetical protein
MHADRYKWVANAPGGIDKLNMFWLPEEFDNGLPIIKKEPVKIPSELIPFRRIPRVNQTTHYFLDDYRFECVWNKPTEYARRYIGKQTLSPDYSLYTNYPLCAQIWNTYRNRWVGAYFQRMGVVVIPSISWGDENSYDFCYSGVEHNSTVAISTRGCFKFKESFSAGYDEMITQIDPELIICGGDINRVYIGENKTDNVVSYILERPSFCYKRKK